MIVLKSSLRKGFSSLALGALLVLPAMGVAAPAITAARPVYTSAAASLAFFDQPPVPNESDKGKETKAEESQEAKFRHSATIEWCSHLFGLDIDTTADLFEYINFAVIALAIGIPLFRALPKLFRKRQAKLSADIEVAQAKTADANERLAVVEAKLKGLDAEIDAIRKQVDEAMRADEARAKASIEEETARILASAEHEIAMAGAQAQRGLRQFAADLAVDRALTKITLDADTDRALIAEFASDITTGHRRARKGEQN